MSVLVPDLKIYDAVYQKAWSYGFNKTCDINYCNTLSFYNEDVLKKHVLNWLWLNEMSWLQHYGKEEENEAPNMHEFITFRYPKTINTYQMLKYLECISYNIEIETIQQGWIGRTEPMEIPYDKMESYELLQKAITEISSVVISQIPEYKDAKWSQT